MKVHEKHIQKAILDYLLTRGYVCKRNNSGGMVQFGSSGQRNYIRLGEAGWPDIIGCRKDGVFFGIEVKTPNGRLTDAQEDVLLRIRRSNGIAFVARSLDDVIGQGF